MLHVTADTLRAALTTVPPAELKGLALLRQGRPASFYPVDTDPAELVAATLELITYSRDCGAAAERVAALRPVPLSIPIEEYGL